MKYYITYERDKKKRPVGTRVILYDAESNNASFGMAICGKNDQPNKKVGKYISIVPRGLLALAGRGIGTLL